MKPIEGKSRKRHYYIILNGKHIGESWAVSPKKAIANFWWRWVKENDEFTPRTYNPEDFDAVEA